MSWLCYFFFYTYVGLVLVAGFWGAFINPYYDFNHLFQMDPYSLSEYARINSLSQYRFLRAIELGFGLLSILFIKKIFAEKAFNILFLFIMAAGVLARLVSWIVDGTPSALFLFFMIYEFLGLVIIFVYTNKKIAYNAA